MTDKQLLKRLEDALNNERLDVVPKDFYRREQWQTKLKCGPSKTKRLLAAALRVGLMEKKLFRIRSGNNVAPIPHYRTK